MVNIDDFSLRAFYEKMLKEVDSEIWKNIIPAEKFNQIVLLLSEKNIPHEYHNFFCLFYILLLPATYDNNSTYSGQLTHKLTELLKLRDQRLTEITFLTKGRDRKGIYRETKVNMNEGDPLFKRLEEILKEFPQPDDRVLKMNVLTAGRKERGRRQDPTVRLLISMIPEANQLLVELGYSVTRYRYEILGEILVLAGILEPNQPHSYKSMTAYFHSRIKSYLR